MKVKFVKKIDHLVFILSLILLLCNFVICSGDDPIYTYYSSINPIECPEDKPIYNKLKNESKIRKKNRPSSIYAIIDIITLQP